MGTTFEKNSLPNKNI